MNKDIRPFHLAFPVNNIKQTIEWYTENLSCTIGRQDEKWVDFNFFGHQISAHKTDQDNSLIQTNSVDGHNIPIKHFGIILEYNQWKQLEEKLKSKNVEFIIKPYTRFKDKKGQQSTMFIKDPSNNVIEFKAFKDDRMIFEN
ncbi:MAG: glyoxalase [Candidatus Marinimicrobia bacterium]|nr:glyoxalase [Candidatus Neomarinimicrobiota bacterium]|tara:strand:+ start:366 stop:791 length:426 start_codon:yes stop_codon:yes gene_type:complete